MAEPRARAVPGAGVFDEIYIHTYTRLGGTGTMRGLVWVVYSQLYTRY